jgi:hypothetical protein
MSPKSSLLVILLCVAILVPVFLTSVPKCNAQQTVDLTVTHEEVEWTKDMLALSPPTTTPEIGLSFQVTIYNNGELPLKVGYQNDNQYPPTAIFLNTLTINFEVVGVDTPR